jgi:hypothetical protein
MSHAPAKSVPTTYGLLASFDSSEKLFDATRKAREAGYVAMDAYAPFAIEGLPEELGSRDDRVPWIVFFAGITGAALGFWMQVYFHAIDYPMNVGGRPDISWPSFIPVTFECGILAAATSALVGMLVLNGLPRPHHPLFGAKTFERVMNDRFYLCIEATDPMFDNAKTKEFLQGLGAETVEEVAP